MTKSEQKQGVNDDLDRFRYITEQEVSKLIGRGLQTLRNDRHMGRGFPYTKLGRSVRYRLGEILDIMESRRIETEAI
jgi:hypothetical protein